MRRLGASLALLITIAIPAGPSLAESYDIRMDRASGPDRIGTSVTVSSLHWPSASSAIVATATNFPDALAAGVLSATEDAPLLLTSPGELPVALRNELQRLDAQKVFILGGPAAVSGQVEAEIQSLGIETHRLAGASRFETARLVAEQAGPPSSAEAVLASGASWPDAVAAGALAAAPSRLPTLLTERDALRPEAHQGLQALGIRKVFISGGPAAISQAVEEQLRGLGFEVARLFGPDRYATSAAVSSESTNRIEQRPYTVVFATGADFPDALAASGLAAKIQGTLILAPRGDLSSTADVAAFLQARATEISRGLIVGGGAAISELTEWQLRAAIDGGAVPTASFGGGTKRIGVDLAPGTYRNSGSAGQTCYWERLSGFGGTFDEIEANDLTNGRTVVTISPSDAGFKSERCGTWSPDLSPITPAPTAPFSDGTYLVGSEIAPGTWSTSAASEGCYWERLRGFSGELEDIIANDISNEPQLVTIDESDVGFTASRCGTWEPA